MYLQKGNTLETIEDWQTRGITCLNPLQKHKVLSAHTVAHLKWLTGVFSMARFISASRKLIWQSLLLVIPYAATPEHNQTLSGLQCVSKRASWLTSTSLSAVFMCVVVINVHSHLPLWKCMEHNLYSLSACKHNRTASTKPLSGKMFFSCTVLLWLNEYAKEGFRLNQEHRAVK